MKKIFLFVGLLFVIKILPAQFVFGASGSFSLPSGKSNQINYAFGANLNLGYSFKERLILSIYAERYWISTILPEMRLNSISLNSRVVLSKKTKLQLYVGFGIGAGSRTIGAPLDNESLKDNGVFISPSVGFLTASHIVKKLFFDAGLSFDYYDVPQVPGLFSLRIGIKYFLK
jgi:hypothetical protein